MTAVAEQDWSIEQFESGCIDAERFDHAAHIYVAWLYVTTYPLAEAVGRFDAALKRLVEQLGAADKYHATLTWFYLLIINERAEDGESWREFWRNNSDLFNSRGTLARYYSADRLFSQRAKDRFALPDNLAS